MEKECIVDLGRVFGWDGPLGHLTGGGTMANLEALWVASRLHPGKRVIASEQAHYTHSRISEVLGIPFHPVTVDAHGRMDIDAIESLLREDVDPASLRVFVGYAGWAPGQLDQEMARQAWHVMRLSAEEIFEADPPLWERLIERLDPPGIQTGVAGVPRA